MKKIDCIKFKALFLGIMLSSYWITAGCSESDDESPINCNLGCEYYFEHVEDDASCPTFEDHFEICVNDKCPAEVEQMDADDIEDVQSCLECYQSSKDFSEECNTICDNDGIQWSWNVGLHTRMYVDTCW